MYCVNCGVRLADTEKNCPLCSTVVYHPDHQQQAESPLYPVGKMPKPGSGRRALSGALLILYLIPVMICLFADLQFNGKLDWFWYAAGGAALAYIVFVFPIWFKKPNPVVFAPCDFAAAALYLMYIDLATRGGWFFSFALPIVGALALITCAVVALLRYLRNRRLYIFGGAFMALGATVLLIEFLLSITFPISFIGWSYYPLVVFFLFGGFLIYLAVNDVARETMERKLFF